MDRIISERIKMLRISRNLSQAGLGIALGVSRGTVSNWELGRRKLILEDAVRIAKYFKVTIDSLVNLDKN